MNMRLAAKLIFVLAVLLFMVMMGMSNRHTVAFHLKPFFTDAKATASIMYFVFFGVGIITGAVLAVGAWSSRKGK